MHVRVKADTKSGGCTRSYMSSIRSLWNCCIKPSSPVPISEDVDVSPLIY
jgi:hypothetical protein